jgi:hypothetical protein
VSRVVTRASTGRPAETAVIDETVAALRARMPRWVARRGLLREIGDGLADAADAYRAAGLKPEDATARAVEDFGDLDRVAAEFADIALGRAGRRAALVLGPGYAVVLAAWLLVGRAASAPLRTPGVDGVSHAFTWLGAFALVIAAFTLVGLRRAGRRGEPVGRWARLIGIAGLSCGALTLVASWLVAPWELGGPAAPWGTVDDIEAFSGCVIALMMGTATWCLVAARSSASPQSRVAPGPRAISTSASGTSAPAGSR